LPSFNVLNTPGETLNVLALSMAVIKTVVWTPQDVVYWIFQQVPHKVEFQVAPGTPPMSGNEGIEPNVVYPLVKRPFAPSEHETVARDVLALEYTGSYVTFADTANAGRTRTETEAMASANFIV
jgi:hypothetical protein